MTSKANDILISLNSEQQKAVTHVNGSMLVLAGAGSGKTQVLTTRIAWIVNTFQVAPDQILAVTFTNKAAKEMVYRVNNLINHDSKNLWIGTFHSIALKILSKYHKEAGLNAYFHILDMQDQLNIIKRIIKQSNLDEERYPAKELQKYINTQKDLGLRSGDLVANGLRQEHWINLYALYEDMCNKENLVDFTELLLRSYELLSHNKQILNLFHNQFQHILVDEFQDTNQLQYKWLKLFKSQNTHIFAVGDDDQSIYSFRGAQVSNMRSFLSDFKIETPIRLEQNYRSTTNILQAANSVIANNNSRIGKNLWTENSDGTKIKLYEGYTEEDEAFFVMDEIRHLLNKGAYLSDITILYRSNAQSRVFEQLFYSRGIAYRVYGGLRFFDRLEIKQILAYLRLLINSHDNDAFLRVVNFPARGIGAKTLENLQEIAVNNNVSLYQACQLIDGKQKNHLCIFTDLILHIQGVSKNLTLPDTISYIIDKCGITNHYSNDKKSGNERLENINELINAVTTFKSENLDTNPVAEFLAHAILESGESQAQKHEQAVQLMTVHAAKGLEFKTVFIVGLEEGLFPHENSSSTPQNTEEERRLMYVAITRAKENLYLLRACSRLMWGKRQSAPISRFVNEIPSKLISNISGISKIGFDTLTSEEFATNPNTTTRVVNNPECKTSHVEVLNKSLTLKIGDLIKHPKFGNGKIMHLNEEGSKMSAEIFFIGLGKKTLDLNIAKIEKV